MNLQLGIGNCNALKYLRCEQTLYTSANQPNHKRTGADVNWSTACAQQLPE